MKVKNGTLFKLFLSSLYAMLKIVDLGQQIKNIKS